METIVFLNTEIVGFAVFLTVIRKLLISILECAMSILQAGHLVVVFTVFSQVIRQLSFWDTYFHRAAFGHLNSLSASDHRLFTKYVVLFVTSSHRILGTLTFPQSF